MKRWIFALLISSSTNVFAQVSPEAKVGALAKHYADSRREYSSASFEVVHVGRTSTLIFSRDTGTFRLLNSFSGQVTRGPRLPSEFHRELTYRGSPSFLGSTCAETSRYFVCHDLFMQLYYSVDSQTGGLIAVKMASRPPFSEGRSNLIILSETRALLSSASDDLVEFNSQPQSSDMEISLPDLTPVSKPFLSRGVLFGDGQIHRLRAIFRRSTEPYASVVGMTLLIQNKITGEQQEIRTDSPPQNGWLNAIWIRQAEGRVFVHEWSPSQGKQILVFNLNLRFPLEGQITPDPKNPLAIFWPSFDLNGRPAVVAQSSLFAFSVIR